MNLFILGELWADKSIMRAYMNETLRGIRFPGEVFDVGGGHDTKYLSFHPDVKNIVTFDKKAGETTDFETERLPRDDNRYDTVLLFNVIEHIFNYAHLLSEVFRITKSGGTLHGFVPFLVRYHPDPHDFFRYTEETLKRIVTTAGYTDVTVVPVGGGPFLAAAHQFIQYFPRIVRVPVFLPFLALDKFFVHLRPHARAFYPLGYYFSAKKPSP